MFMYLNLIWYSQTKLKYRNIVRENCKQNILCARKLFLVKPNRSTAYGKNIELK